MPWQFMQKPTPPISENEARLTEAIRDNVDGIRVMVDTLTIAGVVTADDFTAARVQLAASAIAVDLVVAGLSRDGDPLAVDGRRVAVFLDLLAPVIDFLECGDGAAAIAGYRDAVTELRAVTRVPT